MKYQFEEVMIKRIEPAPGQESVWDYPRPPRVEPSAKQVKIIYNGETIAETTRAVRVLETSHPPVYYIPKEDVRAEFLMKTSHRTACEFKGTASYWTLKVGDKESQNAAWSYERPYEDYESITGYLAFYPGRVDACFVGDEQVQAQAGDFYGGWITAEIVGPFKGAPGTWGW